MIRIKKDNNFVSMFDDKTGMYVRSNVIENGKNTGREAFKASFPELIDVGIMGHCLHGRTGLCLQAGVECYQDGLHSSKSNMTLEDFRRIAKECHGKTFQFALGGAGDPDQHECFEEILKTCREYNIVPNFTTSGFGMTKEVAELCRKYCGAVAVSWYRSQYTWNAINLLVEAGVKTNIHYVLMRNTVKEAYERLQNNDFPSGINAIIFLLHKPVGLGKRENMITKDNEIFRDMLHMIDTRVWEYKIGFDSCSVPAIISDKSNIDIDSLDTCEGARWSAYISADMKMMPCSFDNRNERWAVDLRDNSIMSAWNSAAFETFREHFRNACPECNKREQCMGGCPICPEIVLCQNKKEELAFRNVTK